MAGKIESLPLIAGKTIGVFLFLQNTMPKHAVEVPEKFFVCDNRCKD
jgi:hypothetical protein